MKKSWKINAKFGVLILTVLMMVTLVACGNSGSSSDQADVVEEPAEAVVEQAAEEPVEAVAEEGGLPFAGEYFVTLTNAEGEEMIAESFMVDGDGTLSGNVESSGMTTFEGKVEEDGSFSAEFLRLGGTMTGTINEEGVLEGVSSVRDRQSTMVGEPY